MERSKLSSHAAALTAALLLAGALTAGCGSGSGNKPKSTADAGQTISFQKPVDPGPDPFTQPADVSGSAAVNVSASGGAEQQPFGGSGSNRVCDRDKLILFLKRHPDRLREWARVQGIDPTYNSVKRYIAKLHPVTLTRDTQVTNHAFRNGSAVPFQAILQAGTAVLVDEYGTPVARCFCGNPLKPAVFTPSAKCTGCPANYRPPPQCKYGRSSSYDETLYRSDYYANGDYDQVFIRRFRSSPYAKCYMAYPDPPTVTIVRIYKAPTPAPLPTQTAAPAQTTPPPQTQQDTSLHCNPPRSQLESEQCAAQQAPAPTPAPTPPPTTTQAPDICHDGIDNEGVPGLVDGADPNCQH